MNELSDSEKLKILISFTVHCGKEGKKADTTWIQICEWAIAQERLDEIKTILSPFGKPALPIIRTLCFPRFHSSPQHGLPKLEINQQKVISEKGQILGRVYLLYKRPLPNELQMRIAYENMIEEYLSYLQRSFEIVVLKQSDQAVWLFVPDDQVPNWDNYWESFVRWRFGMERLVQTFVLLVNSVRLAGKGLSSVPEIPILTDAQRWLIAGFYYATLRQTPKLYNEQSNKLEEDIKKDLKTKRLLSANAHYYNRTAATQVIEKMGKGTNLVGRIKQLIQMKDSEFHRLDALLKYQPNFSYIRTAGDKADDFCYSCGRELNETEPKLKANKFIFSSPSQRSQSNSSEAQPNVCYDCAVIGFASPVKLVDEGFVVTFIPKEKEFDRYSVENYIRQYTLAELNLIAGQRIVLPCPYNEHIPKKSGREALNKAMGTVQYALYKLATLFPVEVFENFDVLISFRGTGGDCEVKLPERQLITLKLLLDRFGNPRAITFEKGRKKLNDAVADAIRYIQADQVTFAEYVLTKEYSEKAGKQEYLADDLHRKFTELLREEIRP
jgi:hypothetical protein